MKKLNCSISKYWNASAAILLGLLTVSGCSVIDYNYIEPNAASEPIAKLRIAVPIGIHPHVTLHPNADTGHCLRNQDVRTLPVEFNRSGFPSSKPLRRIGIPGGVTPPGMVRSEFYIPAGSDLTFAASYSALDGSGGGVTCTRAFRFSPLPGKNYEMSLLAGANLPLHKACFMGLHEVMGESEKGESLLSSSEVETTPVIVKGSRAWKIVCESKSQVNLK